MSIFHTDMETWNQVKDPPNLHCYTGIPQYIYILVQASLMINAWTPVGNRFFIGLGNAMTALDFPL